MSGARTDLIFEPWWTTGLEREPVTIGLPFAPGVLASAAEARLFDGDAEVYCQRQVLSSWPDGSVRWLLLDFQVDLPPARKRLVVCCDQGAAEVALTETGISLAEEGPRLVVDNGPLRLVCRRRPFCLFETVHFEGAEVLSAKDRVEFRLADLSGTSYSSAKCRDATLTVEASGPLRAAVRFDGSHLDDNAHPLLDFSIVVTTWSDKPYAVVDYQAIHRGGSEVVELHQMSCEVACAAGEPVRLHSGRPDRAAPGQGAVARRADDAVVVDVAREACEARLARPGAPMALPWVGRTQGGRGLALAVRHAVEQFPKRFAADRGGLTVGLYPPGEVPLRLHQGSAKSHQLLFLAHSGELDYEALWRRLRLLDLAPRPRIPLACYHRARAFGGRYPRRRYYALDAPLDEAFDHRPRGLGIVHFGDEPHAAGGPLPWAPDGVVWSNNAGDLAHALFVHYARTGAVRQFAAGEAMVRHVVDVDHVHFSNDPLRDGGLAAPDLEHCSSGRVAPAHQWVEGLLDYHHLSGCPRSLHAARRIGENVLRHIPRLAGEGAEGFEPLGVGWALYTAATLYRELARPHYFEAARKLFGVLAGRAAAGHGVTAAGPLPAGHCRVSVAGVVLTAVHRHYLISEDPRAAELLVREVDTLVAGDREALWRPVPGAPLANALFLEPLACAHELTNDPVYLDVAEPLVRRLLRGPLVEPRVEPDPRRGAGNGLVCRAALVPASGPALACVVRPLLAYLAAAEAAGRMERLGLDH